MLLLAPPSNHFVVNLSSRLARLQLDYGISILKIPMILLALVPMEY